MSTPIFQSIYTRSIPATNTKPQRITARTTAGHKITLSWHSPKFDDLDSVSQNVAKKHARIAQILAEKLEWNCTLIQGAADDRGGFVFVHLPQFYAEALAALRLHQTDSAGWLALCQGGGITEIVNAADGKEGE